MKRFAFAAALVAAAVMGISEEAAAGKLGLFSGGSFGSSGASSGGSSGSYGSAGSHGSSGGTSYGSYGSGGSYGSSGSSGSYGSTGSNGSSGGLSKRQIRQMHRAAKNASRGSSGSSGSTGSYGSSGSSGGSYGSTGSSGGSHGVYLHHSSSHGSHGASHGSSSYGSASHGHSSYSAPVSHGYAARKPQVPYRSTAHIAIAAVPTQPAVASKAGFAFVVVQLPEDATLYLGGNKTTMTGGVRKFKIPVSDASRTYPYAVRAELVRDGQVYVASSTETLVAGKTVSVKVNDTAVAVAAR